MLTNFGEGRPSIADREQRPQYIRHLDLRTNTVTSEKDTLTYSTEGWKEEDSTPLSSHLYVLINPIPTYFLNNCLYLYFLAKISSK